MALDDFDSDDNRGGGGGGGGDYRYGKSSGAGGGGGSSSYRSAHNQKASILKSSKKASQYSDDDDDDDTYGAGGARGGGGGGTKGRYDSPLNSQRSTGGEAATSGKPPSGRLQPIALPYSSGAKTLSSLDAPAKKSSSNFAANDNDNYDHYTSQRYESPYKSGSGAGGVSSSSNSKANLPAITYPMSSASPSTVQKHAMYNNNDASDDSATNDNKYAPPNSLAKKKTPMAYEIDMKSGSGNKYDRYDAAPPKKLSTSNVNSKFDAKYDDFYDDYDTLKEKDKLKSDFDKRNPRSGSLDRLNAKGSSSLLTAGVGGNGGGGAGAHLSALGISSKSKFNSTNNLANGDTMSERSYTNNSFSNTNMSIKEAKNNYLVGSLSALNGKGLLSNEELDRHFVDRKARVLIATWNMGGVKKLPSNLSELVLPEAIQTMPDIYVIGVQEFELTAKEWEIGLQEHIGPTHVKLASFYHGSIGTVLFIKRELIWFCSVVESDYVNLRPVKTPMRTKASLLVSFQLFGTLMCFICSHFEAGEGNVEQRIANYKTTIGNIRLPKRLGGGATASSSAKAAANNSSTGTGAAATATPIVDGTENFDTVFWLGDLNFRLTKERERIERAVTHLRERRSHNYEDVTEHDELRVALKHNEAFCGFTEGRITFEPTYKYDVNTDNYETSDKCRIPSYCDRILYRSRHKGAIACSYYDLIKDIKLSDHRAVFGLYEVTIRPGVDKVPLSYGDFDRQVYAAGYQKRQMFRAYDVGFGENHEASSKKSPCSIQ